jgi:hypothetical protein
MDVPVSAVYVPSILLSTSELGWPRIRIAATSAHEHVSDFFSVAVQDEGAAISREGARQPGERGRGRSTSTLFGAAAVIPTLSGPYFG